MTVVQHTLDVLELRLDQIVPNPDNIRRDLGDLDELAANIAQLGVLEPLIVYFDADRGVYVLIAGHRRFGASEVAGLATVPAVVKERPDDVLLAEMMLAENTHRAGLDPIDEALALERIRKSGKYRRVDQIAKAVHRSKEWVSDRIALTELPEEAWEPIRRGDVPIRDAVALARADLPAERKAQLLSVDGDDRARQIRVAIDDQRRLARQAEIAEEYGDLLRGADFYTFRQQAPWGLVELGDQPGQLNLPVALHRGSCDGHVASIDWDENPHAWCSRPLEHAAELGLDVPAKAQPLQSIDMDRFPESAAHEQHCPHHRDIVVGHNTIAVCVDPTIHTNAKRKGYQSVDDLRAAWRAAQGDRQPGEPLRHEQQWSLPPELLEMFEARLREALEQLPKFALQALVVGWGIEYELREIAEQNPDRDPVIEYMATTLPRDIRQELYGWVHRTEQRDADDRFTLDVTQWALQACVDVGAPPPNLDQIRTRIEVITKGETEEEDDA